MQRVMRAPSLALALFLAVPVVSLPQLVGCSKKTDAKTYSAKGVVKSFSPDRKIVNIRHDDIPGYMTAMTMSFEAKTPAQVEGLNAGDKIAFSFSDDDGRRVITELKKE